MNKRAMGANGPCCTLLQGSRVILFACTRKSVCSWRVWDGSNVVNQDSMGGFLLRKKWACLFLRPALGLSGKPERRQSFWRSPKFLGTPRESASRGSEVRMELNHCLKRKAYPELWPKKLPSRLQGVTHELLWQASERA